MKKVFYLGLIGLFLFEIANVYFIMPMPGSQEVNSLDVAYFLYTWRWFFRVLFILMILAEDQVFTLSNDTLISGGDHYNFIGKSLDNNKPDLKKLNAYQEYWHSWQIFHPLTKKQ